MIIGLGMIHLEWNFAVWGSFPVTLINVFLNVFFFLDIINDLNRVNYRFCTSLFNYDLTVHKDVSFVSKSALNETADIFPFLTQPILSVYSKPI